MSGVVTVSGAVTMMTMIGLCGDGEDAKDCGRYEQSHTNNLIFVDR
jgi:hypothetical protein